MMWNEIVSMAMNNGIWAVLFCLLFLYEIKDSRRREQKYQDTVTTLSESVQNIKKVRDDCVVIKLDCSAIKEDCAAIKRDIGCNESIKVALAGIKHKNSTARRTAGNSGDFPAIKADIASREDKDVLKAIRRGGGRRRTAEESVEEKINAI